jgi:hypothetical protein
MIKNWKASGGTLSWSTLGAVLEGYAQTWESPSLLCFALSDTNFNVHGFVHCKNTCISVYLKRWNVTQLYLELYLETALHVLGGNYTHQERIQLYLQHLIFVTPLLLSATILEELELPVPTLPR